MTRHPRVITSNREFPERLHTLSGGDIIACRLRLKYAEEHLLLDMLERGVQLIPSASSQLASRSKTFQARLFSHFMIPHTVVIYDIHGLLATVSLYGRHSIGKVILKHDRKNAGLGIHLFQDIEDVYTQAANNVLPYPFVLQPFVNNSRDIRVIILKDYIEAYERSNPDSFRNNLHCGGQAASVSLTKHQLALCRNVMERGSFPYAHLDLMITENSETYLAEINLRGGIRGAAIDPGSYQEKVKAIEETLLQDKLSPT
ncbi:RimK-like protein [Desulfocapsa sulfexigens DSM 10523]|uniref:RimK-like protein n=1 Tax=Desulfocapsa sulfexigens (strain DSM 10523 / SB164P1) TaxID=1167006 RepID=M1PKN3_DESSD|nr:RimK-like protein [Desulfocapsa sulfexigens]AGF77031.1 RimK-like protein [Desulfocapsa sulfexigens DSM 10523]